MTAHRCTGSADTCATCADRRDAFETGPLPTDLEAATRRDQQRYEDRVYGETRRCDERSAGPYLSGQQEREFQQRQRIRKLRAFDRRTA